MICLPLFAFAQTKEQQYYIYNIITFSGSLKNEGFKVDIDDGKKIEKLKDKNGEKMEFKTPAAALMYLYSIGWELYVNGATSEGEMAAHHFVCLHIDVNDALAFRIELHQSRSGGHPKFAVIAFSYA